MEKSGARLDLVTWPSLDGHRPLMILPIGSCEQHGPHLPLGTDTIIATALADRAAAQLGDGIVVAPALAITASGEHQGFPGTLSLGTTVVEELLVELVRSADWSGGIVLVNGHGGNHTPVTRAVERSTAESRRVLAWWPRVAGGDPHAGRTETSILLALDPALVDDRAMAALEPVPVDADAAVRLRTDGVRAVSASGVLGDPAGATAEHGHEILNALTTDLVGTIEAWR